MKNKQEFTKLVLKAQKGDQTALNDLISECYQDLYYFAFQTVKDPDIAGDVTQESCMEIVTNLGKLRSPEAFHVWARQITYHQCARHFRQTQDVQAFENEDGESILDELPDESAGSLPEQVVEDKEFVKTLQDLLDSLPAEQRSAMMLYYYEKLSVKQIADVFSTSEGTIKSRLNYGRKAMKGKIEEYEKKNGIRLHSSVLPLLLLWLFRHGLEAAPKAAMPVLTGTAGAASAGAASAGAGLAAKIAAGVVAAVVAVGAVIGGVTLLGENEDNPPSQTIDDSSHIHHFIATYYDQNGHGGVCECGDEQIEQHIFIGRKCTVCDYAKDSEGLAYREVDGGYAVIGIGSCTDTDISIPDTYQGKPVVEIAPKSVHYQTISTGRTYSSLTVGAFENETEITSVFIPASVKKIGPECFAECTSLSSVVMESGVSEIGEYAFYNCTSLTDVTIPESVIDMRYAFPFCTSLNHVTIPSSVIFMNWAFYNCSGLTDVIISEGITDISNAFDSCTALTEITVPASVINMNHAFPDCTSLANVNIPDGVTDIRYAFWRCTPMTQITIPVSVTEMGGSFYRCTALTDIYYEGTMEQWEEIDKVDNWNRWDEDAGEFVVHCTDGDLARYQA